MKAVIEIVKRFLFEIICGVGAIAGIVLIYLGMTSMSSIKQDMQTALGVRNKLKTAANSPNLINKEAVDAAKNRADKIMATDKNLIAKLREMNYYEPLTGSAFPASSPAQRSEFKNAYQEEVNSWLTKLNAGDIPTSDDIAQMRDRIKEDQNKRKELGLGSNEDENALVSRPEVRASIAKAQSIYLYATEDSFHQSEVANRSESAPMYVGRPPTLEQMWHAQLEVWVQRLIVDRIADINRKAASKLSQEGEKPWVGNLPIKELVSIQSTKYYVTDTGTRSAAGRNKTHPEPPGNAETVFTQNKSNDLYELMQLTMVLVVDAEKIPAITAELCQDRFLTVLSVEYEAVEPNPEMNGKIYGDKPVVQLKLDMETQFFSEFYLPLMPDEILTQLNKKRPEPPKTDGA